MKHKGLSLIEILISLAILSVILIATMPMITVKTRGIGSDTREGSVWRSGANPAQLTQNGAVYPNLIVGATSQEVLDSSTSNDNNQVSRLFVYNHGYANKDLPSINIGKVLYYFGNLIDGDNGHLTITNVATAAPENFLSMSDNFIRIREKLVVDSSEEEANIVIGEGSKLPYASSAIGADAGGEPNYSNLNSVKGAVLLGYFIPNAAKLGTLAVDNNIYIGPFSNAVAGRNTPIIRANDVQVLISGDLNVGGYLAANDIYNFSDKRLKNIKRKYKSGLNQISKIKPVEFTYKNDNENKLNIGVIAQDLQKVLPEAVKRREDGYLTVNEPIVFYALLNSVKELNKNYEKIKANNDELEKRIEKLKKQKGVQ